MDQNKTVELLKEVYQSCITAMDAIGILIPKTNSMTFRASLQQQQEEYHQLADEASMQLQGFRELPNENSVFSKLGMWTSVQMSTITNQNTEHFAELMINGSTMGIIEMTQLLNHTDGIDPHAKDLAERLLETEHNNIELMKSYL